MQNAEEIRNVSRGTNLELGENGEKRNMNADKDCSKKSITEEEKKSSSYL